MITNMVAHRVKETISMTTAATRAGMEITLSLVPSVGFLPPEPQPHNTTQHHGNESTQASASLQCILHVVWLNDKQKLYV